MIPKNHSQNYIDASIKPKKKRKKIGTKFGKSICFINQNPLGKNQLKTCHPPT